MDNNEIRQKVLAALEHPEAEEGLYLDNFHHLHEEDERVRVNATELQIVDALKELIAGGKVTAEETGDSVIFLLKK